MSVKHRNASWWQTKENKLTLINTVKEQQSSPSNKTNSSLLLYSLHYVISFDKSTEFNYAIRMVYYLLH